MRRDLESAPTQQTFLNYLLDASLRGEPPPTLEELAVALGQAAKCSFLAVHGCKFRLIGSARAEAARQEAGAPGSGSHGPGGAQRALPVWQRPQGQALLRGAAGSDDEVVALPDAAVGLPRQDVSMQLPLPRLLSPALERLRAAVADGDPDQVAAAVPVALVEVDTPIVRAGLVRAVLGLRDAGRVAAEVAAAVAVEQASRSTELLEASLLAALRVSVGAATTPAGLLVVSRS